MLHSSDSLQNGADSKLPFAERSGKTGWECPSNIALVKYWGKHGQQLPMNPSLSFTLKESVTRTLVAYHYDGKRKQPKIHFSLEGDRKGEFLERITHYIGMLQSYLPWIQGVELTIESSNTFPHSSGIASSASAYGALALALVSLEEELTGIKWTQDTFFRKASYLARLGSGSACRSVYGGWTIWGKVQDLRGSSDTWAVPLPFAVHPLFQTLNDSVLILDEDAKTVSSSQGHRLMEGNLFSVERFRQASTHLQILLNLVSKDDWFAFIDWVEYEALCLHAMMLTSFPGYILLKPQSLEALQRIRRYRDQTRVPVGFTIDAGAAVHVLYPEKEAGKVRTELIQGQLAELCAGGRVIHDTLGSGPVKLIGHE